MHQQENAASLKRKNKKPPIIRGFYVAVIEVSSRPIGDVKDLYRYENKCITDNLTSQFNQLLEYYYIKMLKFANLDKTPKMCYTHPSDVEER